MSTTDPGLAEVRAQRTPEWEALSWVQPEEKRHRLTFQTKGGSPEAVALLRDEPHGPVFPPLSAEEFAAIENRLGISLPGLLRRVYTEVGDGGFGPGYGIFSLGLPERPSMDLDPVALFEYCLKREPDSPVLRLGMAWCNYGCAIHDWVSLTEPGQPVRRWESEDARDALATPGVPLIDWFENWLAGAAD